MDRLQVGEKEFSVVETWRDGPRKKTLLVKSDEGRLFVAHAYLKVEDVLSSTGQIGLAAHSHELQALSGLAHPGLPTIDRELSDEGECFLYPGPVPCQVTILHHIGGRTLGSQLDEFAKSGVPAPPGFIRTHLLQLAEILFYLHKNQLMHLDVHLENVLISDPSSTSLIDFEWSLTMDASRLSERTILRIDPRRAPDQWLLDIGHDSSEASPTRQEIHDSAYPWLDFYQFGILVGEVAEKVASLQPATENSYLREISRILTTYPSCRTVSYSELRSLLEKASIEFLYPYGVLELTQESRAARHMAIVGGYTLPKVGLLADLVATPAMRRLKRVNQLTLVEYVYEGAVHKRHLHLMHTTALTRELLSYLFADPLFRATFSAKDVRFLLAAVMLHDINHIPFLHTFQEARIPGVTDRNIFEAALALTLPGLSGTKTPTLQAVLDQWDIDKEALYRVTLLGRSKRHELRGPIEQFTQSVVDSGVDVDKLSYLWLDSHFTGVPIAGGIDYSRLFRSAKVVRDKDGMLHLGFDERALAAIEHVLHARMWNFRSIYWHKHNRSIMSMFLQVVDDALVREAPEPSDFIESALRMSEADMLVWLDERVRRLTGSGSILEPLRWLQGDGAYLEAYEVRPQQARDADDLLYLQLVRFSRRQSGGAERQAHIRIELAKAIERRTKVESVHVDEVLLDIPARQINDYGGPTYVTVDNRTVPLEQASDAALGLGTDYDRLAKRIRVFVSPRIAAELRISMHDNSNVRWMGDELLRIVRDMPTDDDGVT